MNSNLGIYIGKDEYGKNLVVELDALKHLLIGGKSGSGKSVLLHKILSMLLTNNSPAVLKLILIDSKHVELGVYDKVPHLLTPVISDPKKTVYALKWTVKEITRRFDSLKESNCRSISEYKGPESMPRIVIVIDEFSDQMSVYPKETEPIVSKIAQIGHLVGVHILLSTSRPSTKVFTKSITDNIDARVVLQTRSAQESKIVMGIPDATQLKGSGDMLFRDGSKYPIHAQVEMVAYKDIKSQVNALFKAYKDEIMAEVALEAPSNVFSADFSNEWDRESDELYEQAKEIVVSSGKASTSWLQRKLGIGYSRAAHLIDMLEDKGVVGHAKGSAMREVYGESK